MWTLYVVCFRLANTVYIFLCFQEIGALLSLAVCKFNRYCLRVVVPMLFIYVCCESLWKPERPHVHYYWPHSIKTKLFSESSPVMASGVYLGSHHWKWECLYKSCQPVAVHSVWLETVKRIWLFSLGEETKYYWTVSMLSHKCVWPILFVLKSLALCTVLLKSYRMFVRTNRLHSMLLFFAGKAGELYCLIGGWMSTVFIH